MMTTRWLVLLVLTACAHAVDPGVRADLPHPEVTGAEHGDQIFEGRDGARLYGQWWRPAGDVRGVLVVQHGLNDHGDRYAHLAQTLVARGYAVYAMDLRGHGRSAGKRVVVDEFDDYVRDEAAFLDIVRAREAKPIFLFGHSMGGVIMTRYAELHPFVDGVILSAPALGIDAPPIQAAVLSFVALFGAPGNMLPQRDAEFTRDAAVVAEMGKDPLLTHADGPTHTVVALLDGVEAAWAQADQLIAPLIVFHGSDDKLTSPAASRDFVTRTAGKDKRHVTIAGGWHDLAHDPARAEFEEGIASWLDAHTGGPALATTVPEPEHLRGERIGSVLAIEAGAASNDEVGGLQWSGTLSGRLTLGRTVGWHSELSLRFRDGVGIDALPAGIAVRLGRAGELSLATGLRTGWPGDWGDLSLPVRLDLELPVGPLHVIARAAASWVVSGPGPKVTTAGADMIEALLAVRLYGDRDLWSRMSAGAGPYVGVSYTAANDTHVWGFVFGLHFYGAE